MKARGIRREGGAIECAAGVNGQRCAVMAGRRVPDGEYVGIIMRKSASNALLPRC